MVPGSYESFVFSNPVTGEQLARVTGPLQHEQLERQRLILQGGQRANDLLGSEDEVHIDRCSREITSNYPEEGVSVDEKLTPYYPPSKELAELGRLAAQTLGMSEHMFTDKLPVRRLKPGEKMLRLPVPKAFSSAQPDILKISIRPR